MHEVQYTILLTMEKGKTNALSHCNGFIKTEIFRLKLKFLIIPDFY